MGAGLAFHATQPALLNLNHFADVIAVKLELEKGGPWVIIGRAIVHNHDGDYQAVTAKLVHDANVVIDNVKIWAPGKTRYCVALQTTLKSTRPETIELVCNTFDGDVEFGSLIAFNVDKVVP
jgi:hypothetical protein